MSNFALKAEVRQDTGKEKAKKLRNQGQFPAIVYGADSGPVSLTLNIRDTESVLGKIRGEKVLVDLAYGDKTDKVFVRNIQRDPVLEKLIHVDFYRVDLNREMETAVPIISVGTPEGVKLGGLLEHGIRQLSIRCLPTKVPPHLEINVDALKIGQSIHVRELAPMDGVRILSNPDAVVFAVLAKQKEEEVAPAAAAAVAGAPVAGAPAAAAAAPAAGAKGAAAPAAAGAKAAAPAKK